MEPLILASFRGGLNLTDSPSSLPEDQVVVCENLDFDQAPLGRKRQGAEVVTWGGAGSPTEVTFMYRHLPNSDEGDAELWFGYLASPTSVVLTRATNAGGVWTQFTALDGFAAVSGAYAMEGQSLHGKLFLSFPSVSGATFPASGQFDRLFVWDEDDVVAANTIRRTGVYPGETGPSVSNNASPGSFTGDRYYRIRFTVQVSGETVRRSEPTPSQSYSPPGTSAGADVQRPTTPTNEGITHWEVEESLDDTTYYRIATVAIGTVTYTDTITDPTQVAVNGTLSEDIGDYGLQYAPKFLAADEDRLMMGGSWFQPQLQSRVSWTPVYAAAGVGNDERLEGDTDPFVDLDGFDGGQLTALAGPLNGFMWAFKDSHIYKLSRTGVRSQAYIAIPVTKSNGAIPRSVIEGVDEHGRPCLYFIDPRIGPMRMGMDGLQTAGEDLREGFWRTVNLDADLVAHGVFYSEKQQVWWWVATDDADVPNIKIKADVKQFRAQGGEGVRRGWSFDTGDIQETLSATLFADNLRTIASGEQYTKRLKPYIGTTAQTGVGNRVLFETDVEGVYTDNGQAYESVVRSKPFILGGLLTRFGVMNAGVVTTPASGESLIVKLIRDYGVETVSGAIDLTPSSGEAGLDYIIRQLDDLAMSDLLALQVEVTDDGGEFAWSLDLMTLKLRSEETT